jgi:hypothetical protein
VTTLRRCRFEFWVRATEGVFSSGFGPSAGREDGAPSAAGTTDP